MQQLLRQASVRFRALVCSPRQMRAKYDSGKDRSTLCPTHSERSAAHRCVDGRRCAGRAELWQSVAGVHACIPTARSLMAREMPHGSLLSSSIHIEVFVGPLRAVSGATFDGCFSSRWLTPTRISDATIFRFLLPNLGY